MSLVVVIQNQSSYVEGPCMTLLENWLITHTHAHTILCIETACSHVNLLVTREYLPQLRLSTQVITRPAFSLEFSNTYDTLSAECLSLTLSGPQLCPLVSPALLYQECFCHHSGDSSKPIGSIKSPSIMFLNSLS